MFLYHRFLQLEGLKHYAEMCVHHMLGVLHYAVQNTILP
jgi:hypothetical protein